MREPKLWRRGQDGGFYVTIRGKQIPLGSDEAIAKKKYHAILAKEGHSVDDESVYKLCNLYLNWCKTNKAAETFKSRRNHLKRILTRIGRQRKASELRPFHVQQCLDTDYAGCSDTYKHDAVTTIKGALNWAIDQGYIELNPLTRMKKPTRAVREEFVKPVDWQTVLDAASDQRFADYLKFAFSSGARPAETRKIEARHCDLEGKRVIFPKGESKGRKRQRVIYLDPLAFQIVERLCDEWPEGMIFRNRFGRPWSKDAVKDRFKRLQVKLKMPGLCATVLRHSFAHQKLISGTDSLIVSKLLGHVDGRMLATRYGHLDEASQLMQQMVSSDNPLQSPPAGPAVDSAEDHLA
jgi:integrase